MRKLWRILTFLAVSFIIWFCLGFLIVGADCLRHGDVGPYPMIAWADKWLLPVSMGVAFALLVIGDNIHVQD